jgi:hypothetical protein
MSALSFVLFRLWFWLGPGYRPQRLFEPFLLAAKLTSALRKAATWAPITFGFGALLVSRSFYVRRHLDGWAGFANSAFMARPAGCIDRVYPAESRA